MNKLPNMLKGNLEKGIEKFDFDSFVEFLHHIADDQWAAHGIVWRGQKKAKWTLRSSLARSLPATVPRRFRRSMNVLRPEYEQMKTRTSVSFLDRYRCYDEDADQRSEEVRMAMVQHYGGHTPLLDWTRSPFVAAFFAYADVALSEGTDEPRGQMAIWGLHRAACRELACKLTTEPALSFPEGVLPDNRRIIAQQGLFSHLQPLQDLDRWVETNCLAEGRERTYLRKYTLPWSDVIQALTLLRRMNITYFTLFPDFQGAALHATLSGLATEYEGI